MKENTSEKKNHRRRGRIAGQSMKKDSATTLLFKSCNENFAELFNRAMPGTEQIRPEDLSEEDIKETAYLRITKDDGGTALVQYRDVVKSARNGGIFAILGIEHQSEIDYAMPFRVLELDFINYARQVQIIRNRHDREWRDEKGNMHMPDSVSDGEYLGRFLKEDRIICCTTLVVYWGEQPWNGPLRLSDLFQGNRNSAHSVQLDMKLLDVCRMTDEEICRYTGELRTVFGFRKYADDRKQLDRFIAANPGHFSNVSKTAVNALAELTHSPRLREILTPQYQTKKGGFNVCKALDGMIQEGIQKGLRDGLQKGIQRGMQKGILTGKQEMAVSLSAMGMSVEKIAKAAKVSEGVVRGWLSGSAG